MHWDGGADEMREIADQLDLHDSDARTDIIDDIGSFGERAVDYGIYGVTTLSDQMCDLHASEGGWYGELS